MWAISNVHMCCIWPTGYRFPTLKLQSRVTNVVPTLPAGTKSPAKTM